MILILFLHELVHIEHQKIKSLLRMSQVIDLYYMYWSLVLILFDANWTEKEMWIVEVCVLFRSQLYRQCMQWFPNLLAQSECALHPNMMSAALLCGLFFSALVLLPQSRSQVGKFWFFHWNFQIWSHEQGSMVDEFIKGQFFEASYLCLFIILHEQAELSF